MKRFLCIFLCAAALTGCLCLSGCKNAPQNAAFGVLACGDNANTRIDAWKNGDGAYVLFLPAGVDRGALRVVCSGRIKIGGATLNDGETTDVFSADGELTLTAGGKQYPLTVLSSENLPSVYIRTESGSLDAVHADKSHKEPAALTVVENGAVTLDGRPLAHIKGRGNGTWEEDTKKKPYNIKFEEKTDLLGMGNAKKWALMADNAELSYIKEPLCFDLARQMRFSYTPECRHVDLYIDGNYRGMYRVCEKAEVDGERLAIPDLDKENEKANPGFTLSSLPLKKTDEAGTVQPDTDAVHPGQRRWYDVPQDPADITRGYLIEFTDDPDPSAFSTRRGQWISVDTPEYGSKNEINYIADLYQRAEDAIHGADGKNGRGEHWTELFDADSFIDWYIIQEYARNIDAGYGSTFLYKPAAEEKLYFGPLWDMEITWTVPPQRFGSASAGPKDWYANALPALSEKYSETGDYGTVTGVSLPTIFTAAYRQADFRSAAAARWSALSAAVDGLPARAEALWRELKTPLGMNFVRWAEDGEDADALLRDAERALGGLTDFMKTRKTALDKGFSDNAALLYYDANGGEGVMFHAQILSVGETAVLNGIGAQEMTQSELLTQIKDALNEGAELSLDCTSLITPPSAEYRFAGWNTEPDGSGETYQPGDGLVLTDEATVLYAQWVKQ